MTYYKISQEELEAFSKKVYEEACYGYLDLKDSVCGGMVRDFLDGRKILPPIDTNIMAGPPPMPASSEYMGHGGYTGHGSPPSYLNTEATMMASYGGGTVTISGDTGPLSEVVQWDVNTDSINDIPVPMSVATGLDGPQEIPENEGIQLRASSGHQLSFDDTEVRPEPNFHGNESERF